MSKLQVGNKVRVFGKLGIFNIAVVEAVDQEADLAMIRFVDDSLEWFSLSSLTLMDAPDKDAPGQSRIPTVSFNPEIGTSTG